MYIEGHACRHVLIGPKEGIMEAMRIIADVYFNTNMMSMLFGYMEDPIQHVHTMKVDWAGDEISFLNDLFCQMQEWSDIERSMSVGDVVHLIPTDHWFAVANRGYVQIDMPKHITF
jgi:hypothetical protein